MGFRPPLSAGGGSGNGLPTPTAVKTGAYTAAAGELVRADASSGAFTVTLPAGTAGQSIGVKKVDTGSNAVAVQVTGGGTIDGDAGGASITSPQFGGIFECVSAGVWLLVAVTSSGGSNGVDGKTVLSTSGAPSNGVGSNGDYAYDATAKIMYGPKASGSWPAGVSLQGAPGSAGSNGILSAFQDEGAAVTARATLDVQGAGATLTQDGTKMILTVPGGGSGITVQDENSNVATGVTQIDFQGAGVTGAPGSGEVVVTIPGGGGNISYGIPPEFAGFKGWSFEWGTVVQQVTSPTAGTVYLSRLHVPELQTLLGTLYLDVATAGSGATALANCFAMLYKRNGANLELHAQKNITADLGTATMKTEALTLEAGKAWTSLGGAGAIDGTAALYGAILIGTQSTTNVQFQRANGTNPNGALVDGTDVLRAASYSTGGPYSAPPATIPISGLVTATYFKIGIK